MGSGRVGASRRRTDAADSAVTVDDAKGDVVAVHSALSGFGGLESSTRLQDGTADELDDMSGTMLLIESVRRAQSGCAQPGRDQGAVVRAGAAQYANLGRQACSADGRGAGCRGAARTRMTEASASSLPTTPGGAQHDPRTQR